MEMRERLHDIRVRNNQLEAFVSSLRPEDEKGRQYARWEETMGLLSSQFTAIRAAIIATTDKDE